MCKCARVCVCVCVQVLNDSYKVIDKKRIQFNTFGTLSYHLRRMGLFLYSIYRNKQKKQQQIKDTNYN